MECGDAESNPERNCFIFQKMNTCPIVIFGYWKWIGPHAIHSTCQLAYNPEHDCKFINAIDWRKDKNQYICHVLRGITPSIRCAGNRNHSPVCFSESEYQDMFRKKVPTCNICDLPAILDNSYCEEHYKILQEDVNRRLRLSEKARQKRSGK